MACPVLLYPTCKLTETVGEATGGVARGAAHSGMEAAADSISKAIAGFVRTMMTWWFDVPSIDVSREPIIGHLRTWFLPIAIAVTVGGLIAAGVRMAVARKANPLIDVTGGLLVIAITAALGILVPNALLKAGDAWSTWVLDQSIGDQFGFRMASLLSLAGAGSGFVLIVGIVVLVLSVVQAVLMLLRETAILILIGMLPLAAAGAMAPGMRGWIKKVAAWLLALIFYKPAAAAVYATAFAMIGSGKSSIRGQLMGLCALVLALVALPVLVKFFTFATGSAGQHSGGGILGAATGAMVAMGSLRAGGGGGGSAVSQARYTSSHMPPPGGGNGPGNPPSSVPPAGGDAPQTQADSADGGVRRSGTPEPAPGPASETANAGAANAGTTSPGTATPGSAAAGSAAAGTTSGGTGAGAAGTTAGTAGAAAGGLAAAGGPVGMAAAAGVAAGQKAADGAWNAAGSAMTPDGSESQ